MEEPYIDKNIKVEDELLMRCIEMVAGNGIKLVGIHNADMYDLKVQYSRWFKGEGVDWIVDRIVTIKIALISKDFIETTENPLGNYCVYEMPIPGESIAYDSMTLVNKNLEKVFKEYLNETTVDISFSGKNFTCVARLPKSQIRHQRIEKKLIRIEFPGSDAVIVANKEDLGKMRDWISIILKLLERKELDNDTIREDG